MICSVCYRLEFEYFEENAFGAEHYETHSELAYVAERGCELCSALGAAFLQSYCDENGCSTEEANMFNAEEDKNYAFKDDAASSTFVSFIYGLEIDARFSTFETGIYKT